MLTHSKCKAYLTALVVAALSVSSSLPATVNAAEIDYDMNVHINMEGERKVISPYIYGVNEYTTDMGAVTTNAIRQGGNRFSAYNWETNYSNAGHDWKNSSDTHLSSSTTPGDCALQLSEKSAIYDINYKLTTLQMAGYVSADKNGEVTSAEVAPSARWNEVRFSKDSPLSLTPDLDDGVVYMDEYVNYLIETLGDSTTQTGYQAYSLDNEPCLWNSSHSLMHPNATTAEELISKSAELAMVVKDLDPNAETFGPALYGYTAYDYLASEADWESINSNGQYNWFIDYYLEQMKNASDEYGSRLLDVLDIHYYSESAKTAEDRVQAVRTLYEKGFVENSWIGQWCQKNVPILPTVQKSIDTYYPDTKLAISEYSFYGGDEPSGAVAQVEALGCFADNGVYFATLWANTPFQNAGINLYTNYDGKGSSFGDTLLETKTDDVSLASAYSSVDSNSDDTITMTLTNKDTTKNQNTTIYLDNAENTYKSAAVYAIYGDSSDIRLYDKVENIESNSFDINLPAMSAVQVVIDVDEDAFSDLTPGQETIKEVTYKVSDLDKDSEGKLVIPIEDVKKLNKIIINCSISCTSNSTWCTGGGAITFNAVDEAGEALWAYKPFGINGTNVDIPIIFDGTFFNADSEVLKGTIAENKVKLETWWTSSEATDNGLADNITVDYNTITVIYDSQPQTAEVIAGDADMNNETNVMDVLLLKNKFINSEIESLSDEAIKNGDVDGNGILETKDIRLIKELVLLK